MTRRYERRVFLQTTSALLAAWHAPWMHGAVTAQEAAAGSPRLLKLKLQTAKLDELRRFYQRTLGLKLVTDSAGSFTLQTGPSMIEWQPAEPKTEPFYHFAFNIPENLFAQAKAWLSKRTPLLHDSVTGKDEVHFAAWDAHAVYFRDPAGNIGELIARHRLKNRQDVKFSEEHLLCVSEIGLVTPDSRSLSTELAKNLNWAKTGSDLAFIGDELGYLIAAPTGRAWLPDRIQKAMVAPVDVTVNEALRQPTTSLADKITVRGK